MLLAFGRRLRFVVGLAPLGLEELGRTQPYPSFPHRSAKRVTLCGSFGYGNAGDEAAWQAAQDILRSSGESVGIDLLSRWKKSDAPEVIDLGTHDEARRRALMDQPLVYLGGGVIEPRDGCVALASERLLRSTSLPSRSFVGVNADSGVHYPFAERLRLRSVLRRSCFVGARDVLSARTIGELDPQRPVPVTGDIVLSLKPAMDRPEPVRHLSTYIAVTLAPTWMSDPQWVAWISMNLSTLAKALDRAVVFVPCSTRHSDDREAHRVVASRLLELDSTREVLCLESDLTPRETMAVYKSATITVGLRLHACVMSVAAGVPCVGLAYHPKLLGFAHTLSAQRFFLPSNVPAKQTAGHYGYSFNESGIGSQSLLPVAMDALENFPLERAQEYREATRDALFRTLGLSP
jgi:polysaccharide pyruvyl transferase WcaK-like protein